MKVGRRQDFLPNRALEIAFVLPQAFADLGRLANRPIEETITATLGWDRARGLPEPMGAGLTPEREAGLLAQLEG